MKQSQLQVALPAVAKSFPTYCKKCEAERYHRVLAHKSATTAKIECEICHSVKTYTLPKAGSTTTRRTGTTNERKTPVRKNSHADEYHLLITNRREEKSIPFSIKTKFETDQKIEHPKFGVGFVRTVQSDRIDVVFEDELKTLMHNKI